MANEEKAEKAETRTRKVDSAKETEKAQELSAADARKQELAAKRQEKEAKAAEAKAEREKEREERKAKADAEKAEREEKRAEEKARKEAEREELKKQKALEKIEGRKELVESGALIEIDYEGNVMNGVAEDYDPDRVATTYTRVDSPKKEEVARRALSVITDLQDKATEVPFPGKDLADIYGGGTVQWVAFFGMLRVLNLVEVYRFKTGERGNSGLSYKWIGPMEPYTLGEVEELTEAAA